MRRKDREMSEEFALSVCDRCEFAVLSMVDENGMPYACSLNIVRDGKNVYFHSAKVGFKIDCLKHNPNVCISCVGETRLVPERFTTEYESAVLRGVATEVTDIDEKIFALKILCERFALSNMNGFEGAVKESLNHTAIWKVAISEISGKSNFKNL